MIGGSDTILPTSMSRSLALDVCVRTITIYWTDPRFEDGSTGEVYDSYCGLPFASIEELLVYENQAAFDSWSQSGADPTNRNKMIHLLYDDKQVTLVVDDPQDHVIQSIITAITASLRDKSMMARAA